MKTKMLPDSLRDALAGYEAQLPDSGASGCEVVRLAARDRPLLYLKHGQGDQVEDLVAEQERLRWLSGRLPVPAVRQFHRSGDEAWLLTEALPGRTAWDCLQVAAPESALAIVDALADLLRRLHALPLAHCPFDASAQVRLPVARRLLEAGAVDAADFDDERAGQSAEQVWAAMLSQLPLPFERVFTHGDCSLDNLLLDSGEVSGCLDVGRAGAADPYQDLAILSNQLCEFGPGLPQRLFRRYGIAELDARRLHFHLCLDEFF